jgi:cob(I)alamin adenosyltransferase
MKNALKSTAIMLGCSIMLACNANNKTHNQVTIATQLKENSPEIKVALLLDTSNSMDGLIDQAKAQLWQIVNELSYAKCQDQSPDLKIALYEYGNNRLNAEEGYLRQVIAFSDDLDEISKSLFELTTNGGE